jgi:hypothetical protein
MNSQSHPRTDDDMGGKGVEVEMVEGTLHRSTLDILVVVVDSLAVEDMEVDALNCLEGGEPREKYGGNSFLP